MVELRKSSLRISLTNESHQVRYNGRRLLRLARAILRRRSGIVDIAVVGLRRIASLNKQFLGRRASTDVLAFNLGQGVAERTWGQIVVCDEVARRIARKLGHRAEDELALYVAHGALHLLGETDDSPEKRERMRRLAARAMAKAGYRDVTSEGSKQKAEGRGQGKRGQICGIR